MEILWDKFKETAYSVVPIVAIVLIFSLFFIDVPSFMIIRFLVGAVLVMLGLTIFLLGIEVGMTPIGQYFGEYVAHAPKILLAVGISLIIGFSVTIAEPDLLILGQQIEEATGGALNARLTVFCVSVGVGLLISLGVIRLLKNFSIAHFFMLIYGSILLVALFSNSSAIAMGFDASGATTGALTTPFILALSGSLAARAGGEQAEENSFGLVGAMSTGPILAVMFLVLFTGSQITAAASELTYAEGILRPLLMAVWPTLKESLLALAPIIVFFFFFSIFKFKVEREDMADIIKGIIYTIVGLTFFLTGVNEGFMDMGHFLGEAVASAGSAWLLLTGFIFGLVVVLAEPAVHVLGNQVEDITGGYLHNAVLLSALSLGVGLAVGLSMLRLLLPNLEVWHFLLPGFGLAIVLTYFVPNLFVGIAFDAGGVASGPMTATFILSFAQGAAAYIPTANALDAFGVIAFVAMIPVLMVELLGFVFKIKTQKVPTEKRG